MDKILIKDLLVRGIIGINPEERVKKQDILVNVTMFADTRQAADSDDIVDAVNYKSVTKNLIAHIEESTDFLVEKMVSDLAKLILQQDERVKRVIVRLEKPTALRFASSVGIEIDRTRDDYGL